MMFMKKAHYISPVPRVAAQLLGARIREARIGRRLSLIDLAGRVGVSENTMRKIERGDPTVGLGVTFEAATIVGVALFDEDRSNVEREVRRVKDRLALLPKAVHPLDPVNVNF